MSTLATANTALMDNILAQPGELQKSLEYTLGPGRAALLAAAAHVRAAKTVFVTGIGSSWHAGMAVQSLFAAAGQPVHLVDASELLHSTVLPPASVVVALSRSGKSVEIVKLLDQAAAAGAAVIGVTNTPDSPLGRRAAVCLELRAAFDRNISITMYSALTLVGGVLATAATAGEAGLDSLGRALAAQLAAVEVCLPEWRSQVESAGWLDRAVPVYCLARGGSLASANETRLLWEEGAKAPACAMTTGGFRHGPQEILYGRTAVSLWIDETRMRAADLALLTDLRRHGVPTLAIGRGLRADVADLVLNLPAAAGPAGWQFLTDIVPGQVVAEALARRRGVDCDNFLYCPYVIETEGGL